MEATVSVVIPSYQAASYVPQALRSVLAQTIGHQGIEIVVVDDGSSDDVSAAVSPFAHRVSLVRIPHSGVSAARNAGIVASHGRYVALLDADDAWLPERLEELLRLASLEPEALITSDFYYERDGARDSTGWYAQNGLLGLFASSAREQYVAALRSNFLSYMQLIPRKNLDSIGYFDTTLSYSEDQDLWLRFLRTGVPVRAVAKPLAIYRYLRPGSTTVSSSLKKAEDRLEVLKRYRTDVPNWRLKEACGYVNHLRLRRALDEHRYGSAFGAARNLARNVPYLRKLITRRLAGQ